MIVAPIPILGRRALYPWTLKRLVDAGIKPLCIVEADKDKTLLQSYGVDYIQVPRMPLGAKWNRGFEWARDFDPDYVLYVGSGDWIGKGWVKTLIPYLKEYDMAGSKGMYFLHKLYKVPAHARSLSEPELKLGYWGGYTEERKGESCGGGRLLTAEALRKIHWRPFNSDESRNMDWSMTGKLKGYAHDGLKGLSISSDLWSNLHDFDVEMASEGSFRVKKEKQFLKKHFKEAIELWNVDGVYSHLKLRM